jgi:hypothetical protein
MELNNDLLLELQKRLKVGNRKGVHLNAVPGNSRYKFDITRLRHIDKDLPEKFIGVLLDKQSFNFRISWKDSTTKTGKEFSKQKTQLSKITTTLENIINQAETIESEKGINTFGFGFPLLVRHDIADGKITVAPVLIWSMRLQRTREFNTWEVVRQVDDPIYVNEVLMNHLLGDSKIAIKQISPEMLENGLIEKPELVKVCADVLKAVRLHNPKNLEEMISEGLNTITEIGLRDVSEVNQFGLRPSLSDMVPNPGDAELIYSGLFSIFEVQKQSIIKDFDYLIDKKSASIQIGDIQDHRFQSITSVETDPSQQGIVNALNSRRNIVVQGPPGTGKSQTLTAMLINALENHKRVVVVCEKRTALEVLYNALAGTDSPTGAAKSGRSLREHCVLIKDVEKDRRMVVDSVRSRVKSLDAFSRNARPVYSSDILNTIHQRINSQIDTINNKHRKLGHKILEDKNWTDLVGALLHQTDGHDAFRSELDHTLFSWGASEYNRYLTIIARGEVLYRRYGDIEDKVFLNHARLQENNPYLLKDKIIASVKGYLSDVDVLTELWNNRNWLQRIWFPKYKRALKSINEKILSDGWIKENALISVKKHADVLSLQTQLKNLQDYLSTERFHDEYNWAVFTAGLNENELVVLNQLKKQHAWQKYFIAQYFYLLLQAEANTDLPHDEYEWIEYAENRKGLEKEQLKYIRDFWMVRQLEAIAEFETQSKDILVENLYNQRSSNRFKRLTLRQIVQMSPDLFTAFFPVILTTPEVCSNLFSHPDGCFNGYFDIVMFDEASQLRLEENLPAMLKGKQIIVSGDEHQMPPSNFFNKVLDGSVENEDDFTEDEDDVVFDKNNVFLGCESLLDFANELRFDKRHLDFHYRSRHPYLIDFSNHAFYGRRLKPMPNSQNYTPIFFIHIQASFIDYVNEAEADKVLDLIEYHIQPNDDGTYPSVGVATFNMQQRDLIQSKIVERQKLPEHESFNAKMTALHTSGFFVKNLENIQGDERDIIILSTTYGPGADGKFMQRFGPVNQRAKGYKLLNVIITRAKHRIYVCSSIPLEYIVRYREFLLEEGSNNRAAVLYAYLAYAKAVSEKNEEARQAVLDALTENDANDRSGLSGETEDLQCLFEAYVHRELSSVYGSEKVKYKKSYAGLTLDVVILPEGGKPGVVVECDANKDHLSREAYLLDYHRKKVLENQGYHFIRVWSVNWWRNPKLEAKKLLDTIADIYSGKKTFNSNDGLILFPLLDGNASA